MYLYTFLILMLYNSFNVLVILYLLRTEQNNVFLLVFSLLSQKIGRCINVVVQCN